MITAKKETKKRLQIIDYIKRGLPDIVECIVLGGSMGYGQYFSVAPWCDIDVVTVIEKENVHKLMKHPYFNQTVSEDVVEMFLQGKIDMFWSSRLVSGVQVDIFVYNKESFVNFCLLKGDMRGYIKSRPPEFQSVFDFEGKKFTIKRTVKSYKGGFLYKKPGVSKGKYWGGVPRDDFFFTSHITFDKNRFYANLTKKVWAAVVAQLKKEHGPDVDLERYNVLNTIYTYQTNRQGLRRKTIEKIKAETRKYVSRVII